LRASESTVTSVAESSCDAVLMFDVDEREALRERLAAAAEADESVAGCALLGSAARDEEDRWSDVDLALRLVEGVDLLATAERWTRLVAETEVIVDYLDLPALEALYRVLLLRSGLQVDLSFRPHDQPLASGAPIKVLSGEMPVAEPNLESRAGDPMKLVRLGWLYALHARSALGRGRKWQALWMLEAIRNAVVELYCRRLDLPATQGRGVDHLPAELLDGLTDSYATHLSSGQLWASFRSLVALLLEEADRQGLALSADLTQVVTELADDTTTSD
jgi:predicted nucleotidyltransferase